MFKLLFKIEPRGRDKVPSCVQLRFNLETGGDVGWGRGAIVCASNLRFSGLFFTERQLGQRYPTRGPVDILGNAP